MKMYPLTRARLWLRCLLSGEKCIACGEMDTKGESLLCEKCEKELMMSHLLVCMECGSYARDCTCPSFIMKQNGIGMLVKYAFYDASRNEAALNRVIARLKHIPDRMTFSYLAAVLSVQIEKIRRSHDYGKDELCITHVPRSRKGIASDGHDQAKMLAAALARRTGLPHLTAIVRRLDGKPQKSLGFDERVDNVRGLFALKRGAKLSGRTVMLVDDVVTTGATVSECAKLLRENGAREVICLCIAKADKIS